MIHDSFGVRADCIEALKSIPRPEHYPITLANGVVWKTEPPMLRTMREKAEQVAREKGYLVP